MTQNYLSFFNLKDDPFRLTPDTAYFYNSSEHATALLSLEYCVKEKEGFCVLTGEPGTGKTTILRLFVEKWKERAEIALIMTPRLSPEEFFLAILDDFKIQIRSTSKNDMLKAFRDFLLTHAGNDRRVAIIVDEAQELPDTTLEELRLLSNLETEKEKLLQIILIGQPELRNKLRGKPLRQLNQRITVRVQLEPLTAQETSDYINTRLIRGGNSSLLYNEKAKRLIFELSGGIPRTINLLASRGLMAAFLEGSREALELHVRQGARDVMETASSNSATRKPALSRAAILAAGLFLVAAAGGAFYFTLVTPDAPKPTDVHAAPPMPVAAEPSSAKPNMEKPAVADNSFTTAVAREIDTADPLQSALHAFNAMAAAWNFPLVPRLEGAGLDPSSYLSVLSSKRGMNLIQFKGTVDGLRDIGYPVILQIGKSENGKEIYTALTRTSNEGYSLSPPLAGREGLTRKELESVWHGKALILWKNHKQIPQRLPEGDRTKKSAALQRLLAHAGMHAGGSGAFDRKTVEALKSFQGSKGLQTTGQPDPQTLLYLYKTSKDSYQPTLE